MKIQESKKILKDITESYHKLSQAVGGFTEENKKEILAICIKNTLINNGITKNNIKRMELF